MQERYQAQVPVTHRAEVVVAGGGLGGVAAALASARAGAKTLLVERNGYLGGVATAGMCCSVFHCLATFDRKIAVQGIPYEIVDALATRAGAGAGWQAHKGHIVYDVEKAKLLLHELLDEAGVTVLLDAPVVDVLMQDRRVTGLVLAGSEGLFAVHAQNVVDATGDSLVAWRAGAPMREGLSKPTGGCKHSYVFRMSNVDLDAFMDYFRRNPEQYAENMDIEWTLPEALAQFDAYGTLLFPHGGGVQMKIVKDALADGTLSLRLGMYDTLDAMQMHGIRKDGIMHIITGFTTVEGLDADTLSRAVLDGRRMAAHVAAFFQQRMPGFEKAYISATADDLGIRASRWIDGESTFTQEDKRNPSRFPDAIGVGVVEHHEVMHGGKGAWTAQRFTNDVYQIPLSCLLPRDIDGVVMGAGRGASTDPAALLRVMVVTMSCGQGAGVAAAVAARAGVPVRQAAYADVRAELVRQGVALAAEEEGACAGMN